MILEDEDKLKKSDEYDNFNADKELMDIKILTKTFKEKFFTKGVVNELITKNKDRVMTFYELYENILQEEKRIKEENERRIQTERKRIEDLEQKKLKIQAQEKKKQKLEKENDKGNVNFVKKENTSEERLTEESYIKLNSNQKSDGLNNNIYPHNKTDGQLLEVHDNKAKNLNKISDSDACIDKNKSLNNEGNYNKIEIESENENITQNVYDDDLQFIIEEQKKRNQESLRVNNKEEVKTEEMTNKNKDNKVIPNKVNTNENKFNNGYKVKIKDKLNESKIDSNYENNNIENQNNNNNNNNNTNRNISKNKITKESNNEKIQDSIINKPNLKNKLENIKNEGNLNKENSDSNNQIKKHSEQTSSDKNKISIGKESNKKNNSEKKSETNTKVNDSKENKNKEQNSTINSKSNPNIIGKKPKIIDDDDVESSQNKIINDEKENNNKCIEIIINDLKNNNDNSNSNLKNINEEGTNVNLKLKEEYIEDENCESSITDSLKIRILLNHDDNDNNAKLDFKTNLYNEISNNKDIGKTNINVR